MGQVRPARASWRRLVLQPPGLARTHLLWLGKPQAGHGGALGPRTAAGGERVAEFDESQFLPSIVVARRLRRRDRRGHHWVRVYPASATMRAHALRLRCLDRNLHGGGASLTRLRRRGGLGRAPSPRPVRRAAPARCARVHASLSVQPTSRFARQPTHLQSTYSTKVDVVFLWLRPNTRSGSYSLRAGSRTLPDSAVGGVLSLCTVCWAVLSALRSLDVRGVLGRLVGSSAARRGR